MKKIAQAVSAFLSIAGFIAMILLLNAMGCVHEYGSESTMGKNVSYIIGISEFQLGVYSAITMVVCLLTAALLHKKFG